MTNYRDIFLELIDENRFFFFFCFVFFGLHMCLKLSLLPIEMALDLLLRVLVVSLAGFDGF